MTAAKAVGSILLGEDVRREAFEASCFRSEFYACLIRRGDELFELCDPLLCSDGPGCGYYQVRSAGAWSLSAT